MKRYLILLVLAVFILATACNNNEIKNKPTQDKNPVKIEKEVKKETRIPSVCVWDRGSLRAEPGKKGKYISAINLGEKLTYLGKSEKIEAEKNQEYFYVELSDSSRGWVSEWIIAINAVPYVATKVTPVYKRPDLSTLITSKTFNDKDLVAVYKKEGAWLKVIGEKKKIKGWIQDGYVTNNDVDLAVGLLASKALAIKDKTKRIKAIKAIVDNPAMKESIFIRNLETLLEIESGKLTVPENSASVGID